jgi:hypothetical protein
VVTFPFTTAGRVNRASCESRGSGDCWPGTTRSLPVVVFDNDRLLTLSLPKRPLTLSLIPQAPGDQACLRDFATPADL